MNRDCAARQTLIMPPLACNRVVACAEKNFLDRLARFPRASGARRAKKTRASRARVALFQFEPNFNQPWP
jgi:hypothetical protein